MKDISVSRLKLADIKENNAKMFIDPDGEVIDLQESWAEIVLALITVLNTVKTKPLIEELCKNKIISNNLIITKGIVKQGNSNNDKSYEIFGTKYNLICNLTDIEYLNFIKKLCKAVKFDLKQCIIYIEDKNMTEQERDIQSKKANKNSGQLCKVSLSEINDKNINKIKITGLEVNSNVFECKGLSGIIELLVMCNKNKLSDIEKEISKYNKDFEFIENGQKVMFNSSFDRKELLEILISISNIIGFSTEEISILYK